MTTMAIQFPLVSAGANGLPLYPAELAHLTSPQLGRLFDELDLDHCQRAAALEAVRAVRAGRYRKGAA
jgi:hypothetical protein